MTGVISPADGRPPGLVCRRADIPTKRARQVNAFQSVTCRAYGSETNQCTPHKRSLQPHGRIQALTRAISTGKIESNQRTRQFAMLPGTSRLTKMIFNRIILILLLISFGFAGATRLFQANGTDQNRQELQEPATQANSKDLSESEKKCIYYGYWDHLRGPDGGREFARHFNIGKSSSVDTVDDVLEQGIPAIAIVGGFNAKRPEFFEERIQDKAEVLLHYDSEKVPVILLMDEPYLKGFTTEQLEELIDLSERYLNRKGNKFRFTFSFARASMMRDQFRLPKNIELAWVNWYPFYEREYPAAFFETKRQFKRDFARKMEPVFEKRPDVEWFVTGQAFGDYYDQTEDLPKWRRPPVDTPFWYAELATEYTQVTGLIWWVWQSRSDGRWTGTDQMPALYNSQIKAFEKICGSSK